jgi:dTDP-4-dehydrorhamnose 3,5-epimerase
MSQVAQPSALISGVDHVPFRRFGDTRGYFFETYRKTWIPGIREMVQGNCSFSRAGVLRGLHYHLKQADLWTVPVGRVRAALTDLRRSSPTRGRSEVLELNASEPRGLYIPKGVAHGFYALEDTYMTYLVDEYYDNSDELGVFWNDPDLALAWGADEPSLSERDLKNPRLRDIPEDRLPP